MYWLKNEAEFGKQAVFLDKRDAEKTFNHNNPETRKPSMEALAAQGVRIIAPPRWMLLTLDPSGKMVPSAYAKANNNPGDTMEVLECSPRTSESLVSSPIGRRRSPITPIARD